MKYRKTHPWLKFSIDLSRAPVELWIMLGECKSKCEHIAGVPLRPGTARELNEIYLVKGSLASAAIEGNTLSENEILEHRKEGHAFPPSKEYLQKEVQNIIDACNEMTENVANHVPSEFCPEQIKKLNRMVLLDLDLDDGIIPGEIRTWNIVVGRYKGAPPQDCAYLLNELCQWLNGDLFASAETELKVIYAIIKALLAHLYIAWIHPFGDGNGRTARLVEFQVLLNSGIPGPAAHLLSNHYNQTRSEYYRQLDRASGSGGDVIPFLLYSVRGFLDGLHKQLDVIREQQWDVTWRNFVHETFKDKNSAVDVRRRHLVLDLSRIKEPVPISKIGEISVRVGVAYDGKAQKTISRDIEYLRNLKLLIKEHGKIRANKSAILSFLPIKAE